MHGQLFTSDFLREGIRETTGWNDAEHAFITFRETIKHLLSVIGPQTALNEAQTEDEVILPVLAALGWTQHLCQQTANRSGRADVPDFVLFASPDGKKRPHWRRSNLTGVTGTAR